MKSIFKNYFKNVSWVLIVILHVVYGIYSINNWIDKSDGIENYIKKFLDYSNGGEYLNIYTVTRGLYFYTDLVFIVLLITMIILTMSSISYLMYELKGFFNFELLRADKKKLIFTKFFVNSLIT